MKTDLPKISIITPCFNAEKTIEQTLESIHSQGYQNLEHIVMDGGSTDGTMGIIKKYEEHISKIVSKKDKGQYFAIVEGFSYATGDIFCWLNSDDVSLPWTFNVVAELFANKKVNWVSGINAFLNKSGVLKKNYNNTSAKYQKGIENGWYCNEGYGYLQQESMFWTKELWRLSGGLNCSYQLAADFDLWIRFASYASLYSVDIPLSGFRIHNDSRSVKLIDKYLSEEKDIRMNLKSLPLFFRIFGKFKSMKFLLRLLCTKKTDLFFQTMTSDQWMLKRVRRPVTGINLYSLLLEVKSNN